jgi:AraC family ethanolamine operon transcriptional activator
LNRREDSAKPIRRAAAVNEQGFNQESARVKALYPTTRVGLCGIKIPQILRTAFVMQIVLDQSFDDLDQLRQEVRGWDIDFRLLDSGGFSGRVRQLVSNDVLLSYARFARRLDQSGAIPPGFLTFVIPSRRCRGFWWRGHQVTSRDLLVFPLGSELRSASRSDFEVLLVSARVALLEDLADAMGIPWSKVVGCGCAEVVPLQSDRMERLRVQVADLIARGAEVRAVEEAHRLVGDLVSLLGASSAQRRTSARQRDQAVDRVVEYLHSAALPSGDMASLCRVALASERTLQYAFRERYGISPVQFVKRWKLNTARRLLIDPHDDLSIGEVAARLGFWHASQFAVDYRNLFGELPSQTVRRGR